jgi:hypothetical protein
MKWLKNLVWLLKNKEKIEELLSKKEEVNSKSKGYSLSGVPAFQKAYIEDLLSGKLDN